MFSALDQNDNIYQHTMNSLRCDILKYNYVYIMAII